MYGYRYCGRCGRYRDTVLDRCPECGALMRHKPRNRRRRLGGGKKLGALENV